MRQVRASRAAGLVAVALALLAGPVEARATARFSVIGFDLLQVNQVVVHVKPGGSHPLCQAIPITAIRVRVKWSEGHKGDRATVRLREPGRSERSRAVTLDARSGTRKVQFDPHGEFHGGTYRAAVGKAKANFRLTQGRTC
jgi:hypothetical protein